MEDEIASIAAVIGASVGGLKAMTATSGPGFSLMQENIGYAVVAEIPCVIVNVMRAGPSTGLPTSPSQGDVMQARWGTHGDHPIIALAPASVREAFDLTVTAFNFAEKYRTPVIVLMDEVVGHMREKVDLPEPEHGADIVEPRDARRAAGVVRALWQHRPRTCRPWRPLARATATTSPACCTMPGAFPPAAWTRSSPGSTASFARSTAIWTRSAMWEEDGVEDARVVVVAYGSTARSARQAVKMARARYGRKVGLLRLKTLWPFPEEVVERAGEQAQRVIVAEMNLGQIALEVERDRGPREGPARRPRRRPDGHPRADPGRHPRARSPEPAPDA